VGEYPQKENPDELIHCVLAPEVSSKKNRKNWARLIQKIYEVDPLPCPKCQGRMRILEFIEDDQVIKKILKHLGLWEVKAMPPPRVNLSPSNIHMIFQLLRFHLPRIISTAIRITPLRHMLHDFFKTGHGI